MPRTPDRFALSILSVPRRRPRPVVDIRKDTAHTRKAIVFGGLAQQIEERQRLFIGQVELHSENLTPERQRQGNRER